MNSAKNNGEVRFWYSGQTPPAMELAGDAEAISVHNEIMFSLDGERRSGPYGEAVETIEKGMTGLQRNAYPLVADSAEARISQFANALVESTETRAQQVEVLKQLGAFRFRKADSEEDKEQKLSSALKDLAEADAESNSAGQLWQLWRPEQKSLLDSIISRPSDAGRTIVRWMKPANGNRFEVVAHRFEGANAETLQPFIDSRVAAYLQGHTIYLLGSVGEHLDSGAGGDESDEFNQLHVLLLHELVEGILQETALDAVAAHVVATTLVRCVGDAGLQAGVESYCLDLEKRTADGELMAIDADLEARAEIGTGESDDDVGQFWADCIVTHDELRSEAFEERSNNEQNRILKEMFGEDWNEGDEADVEQPELASMPS